MSVQLDARPAAYGVEPIVPAPTTDIDLDAVDRALDRGDLESVRCLLGLSREAWRLMLAGL